MSTKSPLECPCSGYHWHQGKGHNHGSHAPGHHGVAFGKHPKVTFIGENLEEKLAASIEAAKKRDADT